MHDIAGRVQMESQNEMMRLTWYKMLYQTVSTLIFLAAGSIIAMVNLQFIAICRVGFGDLVAHQGQLQVPNFTARNMDCLYMPHRLQPLHCQVDPVAPKRFHVPEGYHCCLPTS
jgi:hypothetical protein